MTSPVRYPGGLTDNVGRDAWGNYGQPDPTRWHTYHNDFDAYTAAQWTVTTVGSTPTAALTNADGGRLLLTTTAGSGDGIFLQKVGEGFLMEAGKPAGFKAKLQISSTNAVFALGLQVTDTTPLDVTDGIYFLKAAAGTTMTAIVGKNASTGRNTSAAFGTLAAATDVTLGWWYDGKGEVSFYINDAKQLSLDASSTYLPDTTLTPSFGVQAGTAAIVTASYDFIACAKYRGTSRT